MPYVESRDVSQLLLNRVGSTANVGMNPAYAASTGVAARSTNGALLSQLDLARTRLTAEITRCASTTATGCDAIRANVGAAQALLMSGPEAARAAGPGGLEPVGIFLPGDQNYPGGALFDPLGLAADPDAAVRLRVAEIKHGRLAMVAFVGYAAAAATGRSDGPLRDLVAAVRGGG